jgi:hypothetical protein
MHIRSTAAGTKTLAAATLALTALMLGGQSAEAAAGPAPSLAVHPAQTAVHVPFVQLSKHLTHSWTITLKPGATARVGGTTVTASRAVHPGYVPGTTCTINIYGPFVEGPSYPSYVEVAAAVECTYPVSVLSVSAYLYSYDPTTQEAYLLNDNSQVIYNTSAVDTQTSVSIDANGYYFGGTNGLVGDPIDETFAAVQEDATYVIPV